MTEPEMPGWLQRFHELTHGKLDTIIANQQRIIAMGTTLSEQLDAATAAIQADVAAVSAEVTALLAEVVPGSTITQAQVDRLTAIDASLKAIPPATAGATGATGATGA